MCTCTHSLLKPPIWITWSLSCEEKLIIALKHFTHSSRTLCFEHSSASSRTGMAPHSTTVIACQETGESRRTWRGKIFAMNLPVLAWLIDRTCKRAEAASSFTLSELNFNIFTKEVISWTSSRDEVSSEYRKASSFIAGDGGRCVAFSISNDKKRDIGEPGISTNSSLTVLGVLRAAGFRKMNSVSLELDLK